MNIERTDFKVQTVEGDLIDVYLYICLLFPAANVYYIFLIDFLFYLMYSNAPNNQVKQNAGCFLHDMEIRSSNNLKTNEKKKLKMTIVMFICMRQT